MSYKTNDNTIRGIILLSLATLTLVSSIFITLYWSNRVRHEPPWFFKGAYATYTCTAKVSSKLSNIRSVCFEITNTTNTIFQVRCILCHNGKVSTETLGYFNLTDGAYVFISPVDPLRTLQLWFTQLNRTEVHTKLLRLIINYTSTKIIRASIGLRVCDIYEVYLSFKVRAPSHRVISEVFKVYIDKELYIVIKIVSEEFTMELTLTDIKFR